MNRDIHGDELGERQRVSSYEAAADAVRSVWPRAYAEGSTGAERSWWVRDGSETTLVAHSWPGRLRVGFWLRVKVPAPGFVVSCE